jgi:Domain of unknown function (DUF4419)
LSCQPKVPVATSSVKEPAKPAPLSAIAPDSTPVIIRVCDVARATKPLDESEFKGIMKSKFAPDAYSYATSKVIPSIRKIESCSRERTPIIPIHLNGFFNVAYQAYADHRPMVISPDMIWLLISQGFSMHVNQNAEALRKHFVQHEGKKVLIVKRGDFVLGNDKNDWESVFAEFKTKIGENTSKNIAEVISARFSKTTPDAAVAFDITLMDAMKSYFDYAVSLTCGIPEITIEGTVEDWKAIEERAQKLENYELGWWIQDLKPILAEFTKAAQRKANPDFWDNMVKIRTEPDGCTQTSFIDGWITTFYPYIRAGKDFRKNPFLGTHASTDNKTAKNRERGIEPSDLPDGVSSCELLVDDNGNMHKFELKAGFFGMRQDPKNFTLRPVIGWAVVDTGEKPDAETIKRYQAAKK